MKPDPKILEAVTQKVVEAVHPLRIILFGSAAREEMNTHSDLDLLVVVSEGVHRRNTAQILYQCLMGLATPVDIIVATEEDLRLYGSNFSLVYYSALKDGREIYAA
jgi:predicted nucleotidyltransferase